MCAFSFSGQYQAGIRVTGAMTVGLPIKARRTSKIEGKRAAYFRTITDDAEAQS